MAGHHGAQYSIAWLYEEGWPDRQIEKDYAAAARWYKRSAKQGYAKAQSKIGIILLEGRDGVEKDPEEAEKWLTKAAVQGEFDAWVALGRAYCYGTDLKQNDEGAIFWLFLEKSQRGSYGDGFSSAYQEAERCIEKAKENLGKEKSDAIMQRAQNWKPDYNDLMLSLHPAERNSRGGFVKEPLPLLNK